VSYGSRRIVARIGLRVQGHAGSDTTAIALAMQVGDHGWLIGGVRTCYATTWRI